MTDVAAIQSMIKPLLPGLLGVRVLAADPECVRAELLPARAQRDACVH